METLIATTHNFFSISAHVRTGSTGSPSNHNKFTNSSIYAGEELRCILEEQNLGHQQSITCMEVVDGIVFTGSQDHTLKVRACRCYICRCECSE